MPEQPNAFDQSLQRLREAQLGTPEGEPDGPGLEVWKRASGDATARKMRLGKVVPPDFHLGEGGEQGMRYPGFETSQAGGDMVSAMGNFQSQLSSTLSTMAQVLLETTQRLQVIENYFERLR